jgi:hypothetical protein
LLFLCIVINILMEVCILFCCHKSATYYQTQNTHRFQVLFQDKIGRKSIMKVKVTDAELAEQYKKSQSAGNLYVIDIKDDSLKPHDNDSLTTKEKIENINLNHMAIILTEDELNNHSGNTKKIVPHLNVYNLGILCFMSCVDCEEEGCPGKSPCSKLAIDMVRLWNALGYNPENRDLERESQIREELKEIYNRGTGLADGLSQFICDDIKSWSKN